MSEHQAYEQRLRAVVNEAQNNDQQFFGFIEMMQTYFNQRVADTLNKVQQQELQFAEFSKGQAEEDNKLCQIISQNQSLFQQLQREVESFNKSSEMYTQNPQNLIPPIENLADISQMNSQRQTAIQQLVQQAMNAVGVDIEVKKHIKNQQKELIDEHKN